MKEFCENLYCGNTAATEVRVSVSNVCEEVQSLCITS